MHRNLRAEDEYRLFLYGERKKTEREANKDKNKTDDNQVVTDDNVTDKDKKV